MGIDDWESAAVMAVNSFASYGSENKEYLASGSAYAAAAFGEDETSVLLVGFASESFSSKFDLPDGEYLGEVSETVFRSLDGILCGTLDSSGIAYLHGPGEGISGLSIAVDPAPTGIFFDAIEVRIRVSGALSSSYSIDGGDPVSFEGTASFSLGGKKDATHVVAVEAHGETGSLSPSYSYVFAAEEEGAYAQRVMNLHPAETERRTLAAWVWGGPSGSRFVEGKREGNALSFRAEEGDTHFTLASFPEGTSSFAWEEKIRQTPGIAIVSSGVYDASDWAWF